MIKKKNLVTKTIEYMKNITTGNSEFNYAVIYGLFALIIILLKQIYNVVALKESQISNPIYFYYIAILGLSLLVGFIIILAKKLDSKNPFANTFIAAYPFLFIILGMIIVSSYSNYVDKYMSFVVFMVILFWIQIYGLLRRIVVFVFASLSYILLSYYAYGFTDNFYLDIKLAIMVSLIVILASTIYYQLHISHQKSIKDLDKKNAGFSIAIEKLKQTHNSLKISKSITDSMYELTQEVLKNERIEDVLQLVLEKAAALIPNSQAGSILLLDGKELKFVAATGYDLKNLQRIRLKPEETFQSALEDKYEPFIVKNLKVFDEGLMAKEKAKKLLEENASIAKSCMTCSFKYQDEFFGSINIDNFDSEDAFLNEDKYLIKQLAREIEIIISVHKLYEQALRPTKYDELTQARTRRYCMHLLKELIDNDKNIIISICTIDINNLKQVNDDFGHDIGDKYLFEFAEAVRNANIKENIFGRVGGDEFLLIFNHLGKEETLKQIDIIKKYLKKHLIEVQNKKIEISFASGIVVYGVDGTEIGELIKLSDKRMYEDKFTQKEIEKKEKK
jgi:diguanylate cyclase (GGDEF)-like protein